MKRFLTLAAAAALLAVAAPALASETPPPPPSEAQDSDLAEREALVRRFFVAMHFEKLMNSMMESMWGPIIAGNEAIPEDKREVVREAAMEAFAVVLPQMTEANIDLYAEAFTVQELTELVAFYESPTGQSLMAKSVILSRQSGEMVQRFTPIMEEEMRRQLCARIDCSTMAQPLGTPAKGR
jgi:hypothetical protein